MKQALRETLGLACLLFPSSSFVIHAETKLSLLDRNPFFQKQAPVSLEPKYSDIETITALDQVVEYRGSFELNCERRFSLYFRDLDQRKWVGIDERAYNVKILDAIEQDTVLVVEHEGKQGKLKLSEGGYSPKGTAVSRNAFLKAPSRNTPARTHPRPATGAPSFEASPPSVVPRRVPLPKDFSSPPVPRKEPPPDRITPA
jgi:hypothetical protein